MKAIQGQTDCHPDQSVGCGWDVDHTLGPEFSIETSAGSKDAAPRADVSADQHHIFIPDKGFFQRLVDGVDQGTFRHG
jgi:hypothetical protein